MKSRTVAIPRDVREQIDDQVLYIARDSIDNALAWEDRIMTAITALSGFHGHAIDDDLSKQLGFVVRKLVFEANYLVHYCLDEDTDVVRVVQFRHGMRQPPRDPA